MDREREIQEIVDRETRAWDTQDAVLFFGACFIATWSGPGHRHLACKICTLVPEAWQMIAQTGLLSTQPSGYRPMAIVAARFWLSSSAVWKSRP
jgi:hypothetical protein